MSLQIESVEELKNLLKASKLSLNNVEEMKDLIVSINASYNPDAARVRVAKLLGVVVPAVAFGVAGGVSFFVVPTLRDLPAGLLVAILGILWGVAGLVSLVTVSCSLAFLCLRRPPQAPPVAPASVDSAANVFRLDRPTHVTRPEGR